MSRVDPYANPDLTGERVDVDDMMVEIPPSRIDADLCYELREELIAAGAPRLGAVVEREHRNRRAYDNYHVTFTRGTVEGIVGILAVTAAVREFHDETSRLRVVQEIGATIQNSLDPMDRATIVGAVQETVTDIEPTYDGRPDDGEHVLRPFEVISGEQDVTIER